MRPTRLLPIGLVVLVVVGIPVLTLTESGIEHDLKEYLGYPGGEDACRPTVDVLSPWQDDGRLPAARDELRAAAVGGKVYLVGGADALIDVPGGTELSSLANLTEFNPKTGRYRDLSPLPNRLSHVGAVSYKGALYVLGGYGDRVDEETSRLFSRYDPARDRWSRMPPMPSPRAAMAVGIINDQLVMAGGENDGEEIATAVAFDFNRERWSQLPPMPAAWGHVGGTVAGGMLYVLGGRTQDSDASARAARYDPSTGRWEELPPLPVPTGGLAAVTIDGHPTAIGGGDDDAGTVTAAMQSWDPATGEWTALPGLRTARHGHAATIAGDKLYVFGGSTCAYFAPTYSVESMSLSH